VDELIRLRAAAEGKAVPPVKRKGAGARRSDDLLPGLLPEMPAG
jgi:hypothetical protein